MRMALIDFYVNAVADFARDLVRQGGRCGNIIRSPNSPASSTSRRGRCASTRTRVWCSPSRRGRTRLFRPSDRHLIRQILRGKRLGFSINEIREIIQIYKEPPGEVGQLKLMIKRIVEKRDDLRQKRRDLEETLAELDQAEESCVERLVELGVTT